MKKRILTILVTLSFLICLLPTVALADNGNQSTDAGLGGPVTEIQTKEQLIALLNSTGDDTGAYRLTSDITIDTNTLRTDADASYSFNGALDGGGYTITVQAEDPNSTEALAPLFDTLHGSVSNLNLVFEGDVSGTTFAYMLEGKGGIPAEVSGLFVQVKGDILPIDADGEQNAAGFAFYSMGGKASDIKIEVNGNIGADEAGDMGLGAVVSSGFIYFACANAGENILPEMLSMQDIAVEVTGDIRSYSANGSTYAFGFGYSTDNNNSIGTLHLQDVSNYHLTANGIISQTTAENFSASAYGMIQNANSNITDCTIEVDTIRARGMNRSAYASGFIFNNSAFTTGAYPRLALRDNRVSVGSISAENVGSPNPATSYSYNRVNATGFAIQLMGSWSTNENIPLEYCGNEISVTDDITARSTSGYASACGFVTTSAPDRFWDYEYLRENHVEVGGSITAESTVSHAFAAGFSNVHIGMADDCTVTVGGNITATAPNVEKVVAKAGGFTGVLTMENEHSRLSGNSVKVMGCVQAVGGNGDGSKIYGSDPLSHKAYNAAGGLIADVNPYTTPTSTQYENLIEGNTVEIGGGVSLQQCEGQSFSGLLIGHNHYENGSSGGYYKPVLKNNHYAGPEQLLIQEEGNLNCAFTGSETEDMLAGCDWYTGNTVSLTRADGTGYTADVSLVVDTQDAYPALWKLTNIRYTITPSAGPNGSITPDAAVEVPAGGSVTFTITPQSGYHVKDVTVDNESVGALTEYTFSNVQNAHTIHAEFEQNSIITRTYTLRYNTNGGQQIKSESKSHSWVKAYDELPVPVREGYIFKGWYLDSKLTDPVEEDVKVNRSSITIYAKWSLDSAEPDDSGVSNWLETEEHRAYLQGYGNGNFGPTDNMTRAEVAQMFYNLLKDQDVPVTVTFTDVPEDAWYRDAVQALASLGIVEGIGNGKFAPERTITRAEFTAIAMRFTNGALDGENIFSDVSEDEWFYQEVVGSIQYGWINGYTDGTFRPYNNIARSEVTAITNRMLGRSADEAFVDSHADELRQFPDVSKDVWGYYEIAEATNAHDYTKSSDGETWSELG